MQITLEQLTRMSPEQRAILYQNARKKKKEGGQEIMDFIDASGLPLSSGGMRMSDPVFIGMEEIAWSTDGRKLMIEAVEAGLPALAGIETLFVSALGERYHPHDGGTINAGFIVADVMRHLGFTEDGQGKMPDDSVAKTAMKWKSRKG